MTPCVRVRIREHTEMGSRMREASVHLTPLRLTNLHKALWLSKESFKGEWPLVWLTYLWHLARVYRLPSLVPMVRRRCYRLQSGSRCLGTVDILRTPIYDSDTRWVILDLEELLGGEALAEYLMHLMPGCRLAVLQTAGRVRYLDDAVSVDYEGDLPGAGPGDLSIYTVRRDRLLRQGGDSYSMVCLDRGRPQVHTEFCLVQRGPRTLGVTGLYVCDAWPHIGWGGWGTIRRRFAQQYTVFDTLTATENLARQRGLPWFCIMTDSSPGYRSARRMYEHYGMQRLLTVDDFFHGAGGSQCLDSYVVYGKQLQSDY